MRYSIGSNFDISLVREIQTFLNSNNTPLSCVEFFGANPNHKLDLPRGSHVSQEQFESFVRELQEVGFDFIYLFNNPCIDLTNIEAGFRDIARLGIKKVTTAHIEVIEYIEKHHLDIQVNISTILRLDTIEKIQKFLEYPSVKKIILSHSVNHDTKRVVEIISFLRPYNIAVELVVNEMIVCDSGCPECFSYKDFTQKKQGIRGTKKFGKYGCCGGYDGFNYLLKTGQTTYIPPENISLYEDLGVESIKLATRKLDSSSILRIFLAYFQRSYQENIIDLMEDLRLDLHKVYIKNSLIETKNDVEQFVLLDTWGNKAREIFIRYFFPLTYYKAHGNSNLRIRFSSNDSYDGYTEVLFQGKNSQKEKNIAHLMLLSYIKKHLLLSQERFRTFHSLIQSSFQKGEDVSFIFQSFSQAYSLVFSSYQEAMIALFPEAFQEQARELLSGNIFKIELPLHSNGSIIVYKKGYQVRNTHSHIDCIFQKYTYSQHLALVEKEVGFHFKPHFSISQTSALSSYPDILYIQANTLFFDYYTLNIKKKHSSVSLHFS